MFLPIAMNNMTTVRNKILIAPLGSVFSVADALPTYNRKSINKLLLMESTNKTYKSIAIMPQDTLK